MRFIIFQITFLSAFLTLFACSANHADTNVLLQIDSSITQANNALRLSNSNIIESLRLKANDVKTKDKAEKWLPVALRTDSAANQLLKFIDSLKAGIKANAPSLNVEDYLADQGKGERLFDKLVAFKKLIAVDSFSDKVEWPALINLSADNRANSKLFRQQLQSTSPAEAQAFLSSLQSDVLLSTQQDLIYSLDATTRLGDNFEAFEAIVGQNAKILKAGDDLEIIAGLGSFPRDKLPDIAIAGRKIPLTAKGLAVHKIKTSKRIGAYSVPVNIQFIDQDGKKQERTFNVEYEVADKVVRRN